MTVTFVNHQKNKINLLSGQTNYLLPYSGEIIIRDIASSILYVNGDAYAVENRSKTIQIEKASMEIEVDHINYIIRVLCGELSSEAKFDYNVLGVAFRNNLIGNRIDEEVLFDALEQDDDDIRISLCTFNRKFDTITKELDIDSMAECVEKLPHIFQKPKQHLKQVNEVRPAAVVSRIGQESISHLASHSEHWKGIKVGGLVPERLLARSLEDDYAIYENRAVKTLVDKLYKEMKSLNEDNIDCSMQMDMDDGHSLSSEQKSYFHARDLLMRGMDDDSIALNQMLLEDQRIAIDRILVRLRQCRSTPLYRLLKKQKAVTGKLKKTNIFMMDKYYKEAYKLWELLNQKQEYSIYDEVQEITDEYEIFCKILFAFALRYFHFVANDQTADIMEGGKFLDNQYHFEYWRLSIKNEHVEALGVNGFSVKIEQEDPILVDVSEYGIPSDASISCDDVEIKGENLIFYRSLNDSEQEKLIKELKGFWPNNKQNKYRSELKQKLYATFANRENLYRNILMVPWKYALPDNIEEARQALVQLKSRVQSDKYDKVYFLTISRPNEFTNIKDRSVLMQMLDYGWADSNCEKKDGKFGIIPIGMGDINSYRRYTKILLEHMIAVDRIQSVCPICGEFMTQGQGNSSNIASCHSCGFQIIQTQCSSCGEKYVFSRYDLPKVSAVDTDMPGFKIVSEENTLGFKNITNAVIVDGQIHPICPLCGN